MGDADLGHGSIPGGENGSGEGRRGKAQEVLKGRAEMMLCPEVQHMKSPGALERGGLCSELQKPVSSEQGMVASRRQHFLRHWVSLPGLLKQSDTGWGASLTREIYLLMVLEAEVQIKVSAGLVSPEAALWLVGDRLLLVSSRHPSVCV